MLNLSSLRPPQIGFRQGTKKTPNPTRTVSRRDLPSVARSHPLDITVVLPFIRSMKNQKPIARTRPVRTASFPVDQLEVLIEESLPYKGTSPPSSFRSLSTCIYR